LWLRLGAISGPYTGRVFAVGGQLTVGRAATCDLRLDDPKVSRQHATLEPVDSVLLVYDHGSLNGTWVNDARITCSAALRTGDRLRIGGSVFVVTEADDPSELAVSVAEELDEDERLETVLSGGRAR
jgi:pSer/pThr/pTyr-binding forkhead associated (FHA) protein